MDSVLYLCFAVAYLILLLWTARALLMASAGRAGWAVRLLLVVAAALVLDNGVLAGGHLLGEGPLLEGLNLSRYWLHALVTPWLVVVAWGLLVNGGVRWAERPAVRLGAVALAVSLVVVEVATETWGITLIPERAHGVLRYVPADPSGGPGVMVIAVALVLVVAGAVLWRRTGWPWLGVVAVVMAVGSAVPIPVPSDAVTNAFELVLIGGIAVTAVRGPGGARRRPRAAATSAPKRSGPAGR